MVIRSGTKELSVFVEGYEFPEIKANEQRFDCDANWLTVNIAFEDEGSSLKYKDHCISTYEIETTSEEISDVISGKTSFFISDYFEPFLKIAFMEAGNDFILGVEYVYDSDGWNKHKLAQKLTLDEARQFVDELDSVMMRFPKR